MNNMFIASKKITENMDIETVYNIVCEMKETYNLLLKMLPLIDIIDSEMEEVKDADNPFYELFYMDTRIKFTTEYDVETKINMLYKNGNLTLEIDKANYGKVKWFDGRKDKTIPLKTYLKECKEKIQKRFFKGEWQHVN